MQPKVRRKNRYEKIKHLGEGQFANVYKAKDIETGAIVAIKKIKLGSKYEARDGINRTALREIKLLLEVHHDNIITLRDVIGHRTSIQLVFDFMETDLEDLKPNNLLMNANGKIKIGDFGLARYFGSPNRCYTHQVVTRWYRAPELLYGARAYGTGVDMWAVGCIIGELLLRIPIVPGESDLDQLIKIFTLLGPPTEDDWPNFTCLPDFIRLKECGAGYDLRNVFTAAGNDLIELISQCLKYDPLKRWSATQALQSAYFRTEPYACDDSELPGRQSQQQQLRKRRIHAAPPKVEDSGAAGEPALTRRRLEF